MGNPEITDPKVLYEVKHMLIDKAYLNLPKLEAQAVDPDTYINFGNRSEKGHKYRVDFADLIYSYLALAIEHPDWIGDKRTNTYVGKKFGVLTPSQLVEYVKYLNEIPDIRKDFGTNEPDYLKIPLPYKWDDHEVRALQLMQEDFPQLHVWRGADYWVDKVDYSFNIRVAMVHLFNNPDASLRKKPVLVGVPISEIVRQYRNKKLWIGRDDLSTPTIRLTGEGGKYYTPESELNPIILRANKRSLDPLFDNKLESRMGSTRIENMLKVVNRRLRS